MTTKETLESFEGENVTLRTSKDGFTSTISGKFRAATFGNPLMYKVSNAYGDTIFNADLVTTAISTDYTNLIEINLN